MSSKKENLKVKILISPPGAGKTTWSLNFLSKNENWVRVNRDSFREMFKNQQVCEPKIENLITNIQDKCILSALNAKQNIIVDNTHVKAKYINHIIELVKYKADVEFMLFDLSLNKCIEQDKGRVKKVGEEVIKKMYKDFNILKDTFDFGNRYMMKDIYVEPEYYDGLEDIYVFDIDGTLAHHNNERSPYDWHKVGNDVVDNIVANELRFHYKAGHKIFIVSGRDAICRPETIKWLQDNHIPYHELHMRPLNDSRKDTVIKREIYENYIKDKFNVVYICDDRDQVCEMWRSLGLKVFQVEKGDF